MAVQFIRCTHKYLGSLLSPVSQICETSTSVEFQFKIAFILLNSFYIDWLQ